MSSAPLRVRPRRTTVVAWVTAVVVVAGSAVLATTLRGTTGAGNATFQTGDQVAMIGVGLLGALAILAFTRPRLEADERGVRIRNLVGGYDLPWQIVTAVRFDRHSAWASLELADDDLIPVMAIQRADREYAVAAVRELRTLLAASQAGDSAETAH